jgi:hypothetical protein
VRNWESSPEMVSEHAVAERMVTKPERRSHDDSGLKDWPRRKCER